MSDDQNIYVQAAVDGIEPLAKQPPGGDPNWHGLDDDALTAAHCAIETELVSLRDARIQVLGPANGFIIREHDGAWSPIMRLGTREGVAVGIGAYLETVKAKSEADWPGLHDWLVSKGWIEDDLLPAEPVAEVHHELGHHENLDDHLLHDPEADG